MSIITNTFNDPKERARAIGVWGGVVGLSMAAGPVVGGLLVQTAGWRSIFWVNIPVGVAAFILTALFVPESRAPRPRRPDPVSQLLVIAVLASLTYAIIEGPRLGWGSAEIPALFAVCVLALAALVRYARRRAEPLIDPRFFRSIPFSGATVIAVLAFLTLAGFLFLNTLYLQEVRGYSALHAGLMTLPMAAVTAVCAPISGRLVADRGSRLPLLLSGTFIFVAGLMLLPVTATTSPLYLGFAYAVFGFGFGVVNAPITNTAVSGMPRAQAGVAAAVASTSRQVGQSLGVAIIGSIIASQVHGPLKLHFSDAAQPTWALVSLSGVLIAVLGVYTTGARAKASAARAAALFPEIPAVPVAAVEEPGDAVPGDAVPDDVPPLETLPADAQPSGSGRPVR